MKIGIDLRTLQEGKMTGVETYLRNLLRALLLLDQKNEYVLFYNSHLRPLQDLPSLDGKKVKTVSLRLPNRILNLSLLLLKFPKIDRLLGGVDIFFSPRYLFTALSRNCKLVVVMHDLSFMHFPDFFSARRRLWHRVVSDRRACQQASAVITVSEATRDDVATEFQIPQHKLFTIHPGLDHKAYNDQNDPQVQADLKSRYGINQPFILYLGTIEPRKNILGIISAFEMLKNKSSSPLELVLAGRLGWLYEKVLKAIQASRFRSSIKFLGQVPEDLKPSLYRLAKATVFPSFFEGFGFPPLESIACGTPAVVAHNTSFYEVLGDAALYPSPYDAGQIAYAVDALLNDSRIRQEYIKRGIIRAARFSWEKTAADILKVFEKIS